jgi:serine phosphatase RsbU (regulator of sigma subunit)
MLRKKQKHKIRAHPSQLQSHDFHTVAKEAADRQDWKTAAAYYDRAIEQRSAELGLINSVQEGLSSKLEMQAIYNLVGDKLRDTFNAQVVMISQYDPQTQQIFHHYAFERGVHLNIPGWHPVDTSRSRVARTRKPYMINLAEILDLLSDSRMQVISGTELPKTWLGVPMVVGNEARGIVSLQNLDRENAFSASDIDLLMALTNSMSVSLENARLFSETQRLLKQLEDEMEIARQAQQSILPVLLPRHPDFAFGAMMMPARAVGGDFYDFIRLDKQKICIVTGDVSDKGLPAALFMALTFSLVRVETGKTDNPQQILRNVNRYLLNMNASGMYVTLLYCILDFETGILKYSRAGHLPPIIMDGAGQCIDMDMDTGQPLGLFHAVRIDQQQCTIPIGGLALLYSDGLNEAADSHGIEFGVGRVKQELREHRLKDANEICHELWSAVQDHSGVNLHQDDFTTVVIKRNRPLK